jgi:cell division transport system ATP-binding protein
MIQLFHVHKSYVGERPALSDVTLEIQKGEFVFLTGPSGAGKSTLFFTGAPQRSNMVGGNI